MRKTAIPFFLAFTFFFYGSIIFSQKQPEINFDSLLINSDAIVLEDLTQVEVPDNFSAQFTVYRKLLIKSNKADKYCRVVLNESHFKEIEEIQASIRKLNGDLIEELDNDDIKEQEYSADAFFSGDNYKFFEMKHHTYPFIFEYEYKISISTLLLWPNWYPQDIIPTMKSEYKLEINPEVKFRYYSEGLEVEPSIKTKDSFTQYSWQIENLSGIILEDYLPPENRIQNAIYFIPENFSTDSYDGSTKSWDEYSNWYRNLSRERYELSPEAVNEITELIKGSSNSKDKIRILYDHLKKKNRYVAIEMGLAGWQPQYANQVFENRYGDCKDLSTYMIAMLRIAGIRSFPALAMTRDDGVVNIEQPSNQFNHCIVFVPLEDDTVWLECTSIYGGMNDMPPTIEDINVLVVEDKTGKIVRTPEKQSNQNSMISVFNSAISFNGDLKFDVRIKSSGNQKMYLINNLSKLNSKDDILFLTRYLSQNYSNLTVEQFEDFGTPNKFSDEKEIFLKGVYQRFLPQLNEIIFVNPAIINRKTAESLPKETPAKRKYPVYFSYPYTDLDSVIITIPRTYKMESKPINKYINSRFANYSAEFNLVDDQLVYVRKFELIDRITPLSDYPDYYDFMKQVIESDKSKFVLKKK